MSARRAAMAVGAAALGGYGALQWLGRTWGATPAERRQPLPGDALVARPQVATTHAATLDAPPGRVWPWLVQMGWGRAGWYTATWVDRLLFPGNRPSACAIIPELQDLAVGDRILDGAPETECWFTVDELQPEQHLVLHSRSHLPPGFRDRFGTTIDWSWVFALTEPASGQTRLVFRTRARLSPRWLAAAYVVALVPADAVMSRQMLRGLGERVEVPGPAACA